MQFLSELDKMSLKNIPEKKKKNQQQILKLYKISKCTKNL